MVETALILILLALLVIWLLPGAGRPMPVSRHPPRRGCRCDGCESEGRAGALLRDLLTADEHRQLERDGYLSVPSPSRPGRTYRVPRHRGRVRVYEGATLVMALCVEPAEPLPRGDVVLLHKLMIEGDEAAYLRVANQFVPTWRHLVSPGRTY